MKKAEKTLLFSFLILFFISSLTSNTFAWQDNAWQNGKWLDRQETAPETIPNVWHKTRDKRPLGIYQIEINYSVHFIGHINRANKRQKYEYSVYPDEKSITAFCVNNRGLLVTSAHYFDSKMLLKYFRKKIEMYYPYPRIDLISLEIRYEVHTSYHSGYWSGGQITKNLENKPIPQNRPVTLTDQSQPAEIIYSNKDSDVALIKLKNSNHTNFFYLRRDKPSLYTHFKILHFSNGYLVPLPATIKKYDAGAMFNGKKFQLIELSAPCQQNSSGAPFIDDRGDVCGMISTAIADKCFAVKPDKIFSAMKQVNAKNK